MTSNELEIFKQSILDDVRVMMQTTGQVTQYIGARYVPLFADPLEWSNTKEYEPLTIVLYQGNSFTSRQFVPKGVDINDTSFWASTGNYNAQIEQYRQEVEQIKESVYSLETSNYYITPEMFGAVGDGVSDDTNAVQKAFDSELDVVINRVYKVNSVKLNKTKTVSGYGTIEGTVYLGAENEIVTGINLSNITIRGNVVLNNYRSSSIFNVTFISDDKYAITRNENLAIKKHHIGYNSIRNCTIKGKGFIKLVKLSIDDELPFNDLSVIGCTANTITGYFFYSDVQDGLKLYENKIQYPSFGAAIKDACIFIGNGDFCSIKNNTIFESGKEAIICNLLNNSIIEGNNIGWCGQQKICAAISINIGEQLIPTHMVIANNAITYQSGNAIEVENYRFLNIIGNTIKWNTKPPYLGKPNCIASMENAKGDIKLNDTVKYSTVLGNSFENCYITFPVIANHNVIANNSTNIVQYMDSKPIYVNTSTSSRLNIVNSPNIILTPNSNFSITDFNVYIEGEIINIFNDSEHVITITNNAVISTKGGTNQTLNPKESASFMIHNGKAYQI